MPIGLPVLTLLACGVLSAAADSWMPPGPRETYSANSNFVARVTPSSKSVPAKIEVFAIGGAKRSKYWECDLVNKIAPIEIRLTEDGRYVIAFDNWGGAGYGPNVLGFYGSNGLSRSYSLLAITGYDADDFSSHYSPGSPSVSTMSVWWRNKSFEHLDRNADGWTYAIWLEWKKKWYAWDVGSGKSLEPSTNQISGWYGRAHDQATIRIRDSRSELSNTADEDGSYELLAYLKRMEDRPIFLALLKSPSFGTVHSIQINDPTNRFVFVAQSNERRKADEVLSLWSLSSTSTVSTDAGYNFLGTVRGHIRLPSVFQETNGFVRIWLTPFTMGEKAPLSREVEAHLEIRGDGLSRGRTWDPPRVQEYDFEIGGINPGNYWVQALWDKAAPFGDVGTTGFTPSPGDFVGRYATPIRILPKTSWRILIDCKTPVSSATK